MNLNECLNKMVPPGKERPGKYRNGVIQVWVTRACDKSCFNCTQLSNVGPLPNWETGKPEYGYMTVENFEKAVLSLKSYWGVVGVFGGNPAMHPQFTELCAILRRHIPFPQRGIWCNNPLTEERAKVMRETFNPTVSNLNVHMDIKAYNLFKQHWPESILFGMNQDSRHSPPHVAMQDIMKKECPDCFGTGEVRKMIDGYDWGAKDHYPCRRCGSTGEVPDEETIWNLVSQCDINQHWSAMIGQFRGQPRAWFCEIAGAQAMAHQHEPDYPDTGFDPLNTDWTWQDDMGYHGIVAHWWRLPMHAFTHQVKKHCMECGVPLKGYGELAQSQDPESREQVSATHAGIYHPKSKSRRVELVTLQSQLGNRLNRMTDYLGNARR